MRSLRHPVDILEYCLESGDIIMAISIIAIIIIIPSLASLSQIVAPLSHRDSLLVCLFVCKVGLIK